MSQCVYCSKKVIEPHPVSAGDGQEQIACSESCAAEAAKFFANFKRFKKLFIGGICFSLAMLVAAVILLGVQITVPGGILMGASLVLMGLLIFLMPFATPQTFDMLQIKKTKLVTRIIGVFMAIIGVVFAVLIVLGL